MNYVDDIVYEVLLQGRISILLEEVCSSRSGKKEWNGHFKPQDLDVAAARKLQDFKEKDINAACFRLLDQGLARIEYGESAHAARVYALTPHEIAKAKYEKDTTDTVA